jgi:hypothetical protein
MEWLHSSEWKVFRRGAVTSLMTTSAIGQIWMTGDLNDYGEKKNSYPDISMTHFPARIESALNDNVATTS